MSGAPVTAEIQVRDATAEMTDSGADLDRWAAANATLAAMFRRVFIR